MVNPEGVLNGILTLDDIVLFASEKPGDALTYTDVVETMRSICEHTAPARVLAVAG